MRPAVRRILLAIVIAIAAGAGWFLYYGGRYLQHEDPLQKADAILVLAGTRAERWLEAYDLYTAGYAPVVVLSPGASEPSEQLLRQRGIRFPSAAELQRDAMIQLRVPPSAVIILRGYADNTVQEAEMLRALVRERGWRRVIVVTSKYHTRRSGFAFRRALAGSVEIVIRASRYDASDPANWWRIRADVRFASTEWEKLIAYRLGLGG
ncbi:MAG TPA: YdcF family protein [Vicinamibacterales bacterium]|nr:YdcF family protein [Vicinamibacterales bacterium]